MKLLLVGGFLGSGKTTAIAAAAAYLVNNEKIKVAVITNDQGKLQVDAEFLRGQDIAVREVSNGCFCCNFTDLRNSIAELEETTHPDLIFAESVGSCTDLIATVINPLVRFSDNEVEMTLSVFADIRLLCRSIRSDHGMFSQNVHYIFKKQLEEADIIVVNKVDLLSDEQLQSAKRLIESAFVGKIIIYQDSLNKKNIQHWMTVLFDTDKSRYLRSPLELDYTIYGAGEAELGWLDGEIRVLSHEKQAVKVGNVLINKIHDKIIKSGFPIGHLKFLVNDGINLRKISFTTIPQELIEIDEHRNETDKISIIINARIQMGVRQLEQIISDAILEAEAEFGGKIVKTMMDAFHPGFPKPTHRMQE